MKKNTASILAMALNMAALCVSAQAATLTWDSTAGAPLNDGGGTWLTANQWYSGGSPNATWNNGTPDDAIIGSGGAGGTITLGAVTAGSVLFTNFTGTYTLSGGGLTNSGGIMIATNAVNVTFSSCSIGGAGGITKYGTGKLILGSSATVSNTFTGPIRGLGGVLQLGVDWNYHNNSILGGYPGIPSGPNVELNGCVLVLYYDDFDRTLGTGGGQFQITGGRSGFVMTTVPRTTTTFNNNANYQVVWGAAGEGAATGYFNPSVFVMNDSAVGGGENCVVNNKIDLNGADRTIETANASYYGQLSGVISNSTGTAGLIKIGSGTLILSGVNTYNGKTTISAGRLTVTSKISSNGVAGSLGAPTGADGIIDIYSGATLYMDSTGDFATDRGLNLTGGSGTVSLYNRNNGQVVIFNGAVTVSGTGAKTLWIYNGTGGAPGGDSNCMIFNEAIPDVADTSPLSFRVTYNTQTASQSYVSLVKGGTFTGPITLTRAYGSTLYLTIGGRYDNDYGAITSIVGSGTLCNGNYTNTISLDTSTTLNYKSSATQTLSGVISGAGNVEISGSGVLTLSATNTYTGTTTVSAGTLSLSGSLTGGTAISVSGSAILNESASGVISGAASITHGSSGTSIISGTNTYTGNTTISAGKLVGVVGGSCANSAVTVSGTGNLGISITDTSTNWICKALTYTVASTLEFAFSGNTPSTNVAPLQVNGDIVSTVAPTVSCTGSSLPAGTYPLVKWTGSFSGVAPSSVTLTSGAGILVFDNASKTLWLSISASGASTQPLTWKGPVSSTWVANEADYTKWQDATPVNTNYQETTVTGIAVGDNVVFSNAPGGVVTLNTIVYPASVVVAGTSNYTFSGSGSIGGVGGLIKMGSSNLTISTTNSYSGGTYLGAGTLIIATNDALGSGSLVLSGGTIKSSDATARTNNNVVLLNGSSTVGGTGNLTFNNIGTGAVTAASTITITSSGVNASFATAFSGAGSITKAGSGTMTLTGTNTYSGGTTVSAGTLVVNGGQITHSAVAVNVNAGNCTMTITNGAKVFSGGAVSQIGNNNNNNLVLVVGGGATPSVWDLGGAFLNLGGSTGSSGSNNVLRVDGVGVSGGAVVTNVTGTFSTGPANYSSPYASIVLTNGGQFFNKGSLTLGNNYYGPNGRDDSLIIVGGAANSMYYGSSNAVIVGDGVRGNTDNNLIFVCAGGILTNAGYNSGNRDIDFVIGYARDVQAPVSPIKNNRLVVTDGGQVFTLGNLTVGYNNSASAYGALSNAVLIANGGLVSAPGAVNIGFNASAVSPVVFNTLTITNGGQLNTGADSYIGRATASGNVAISNTAFIGGVYNGTNATWNLGGKNLTIGSAVAGATSTNNSLTVSAGGVVTNLNALLVSSGAGAISNSVVLSAGGQIFAASATITNNNFLTVGIDDAATPGCGYLGVSGNMNISGATLNITSNGAPSSAVYVVASYGTLTGSFGATNGLPSGWIFSTNYQGNKIALIQPLPVAPAVVNSGTANQGAGVCTLQGMVTSSGVANAWICWGPSDGGTNAPSAWSNAVSMGQVLQGNTFSTVASSLATNVTYWYRCYASNSYGTAWASPATWFNAAPAAGGGGGGGGTAVGFWTPSNITLVAWYDASDTNTVLTSGSAVTNWLDKSGNGLKLIQTTGSLQPVTGAAINSLNAIDFTGDKMTTASNPFGATISNAFVITVHKVDSIANADLFSLTGSDTAANRWQSHAPWGDGNLYFDCGGSGGANRIYTNMAVSVGNVVLLGFYCSTVDNVQQVYKNGSVLTNDGTGHAVNTAGNISVGGLSNFQDATLGEFIIINGTVNAATRQKLEGYLAWKWGLQGNLPAIHPFKLGPPSANGGVVTYTDSNGLNPSNAPYAGGYVVHTFYGSDTFSNSTATSADVLVVAGGGGGGKFGGGGGAGGLIYSNAYPISPGPYNVTIGGGGSGDTDAAGTGGQGTNSVFGSLTAYGGGGGGSRNGVAGVNGAGGGGGGGGSPSDSPNPLSQGGAATNGQGNAGGSELSNGWGAGGGGGAGVAGGTASANNAGNGGNGLTYNLVGSNVTYAGGGGGCTYSGGAGTAGSGGTGGGGAGAKNASGGNGSPNTGGGGGGGDVNAGQNGGSGGSGIVILRYPFGSGNPIVNVAPTAITNSSAVFNGQLACPTTNYSIYVHWGTTDGTDNFSAWSSSAYVGVWTNVASTNISYTNMSLTGSTTYYYTFRGTNASTNVWASPSWQFTTLPSGEDVNFTTLFIY